MATEFNKQFKTAAEYLQANEEELEQVTAEMFAELAKAALKHPAFPEDLIHRAAIVGEESGELLRACLQLVYETGEWGNKEPGEANTKEIELARAEIRKEALHTAATAIRFLLTFNS